MDCQRVATKLVLNIALLNILQPLCAHAATIHAEDINQAIQQGQTYLQFRPRYEKAQEANLQNGKATTLRTQVGFESAELYQTAINIELTDVSNFFGQSYNPMVRELNKPEFASILDVKGTGVTNAKFSYTGIQDTHLQLGRQYFQLNNERFVSKQDFRQFPQSFDAVSLENTSVANFTFFYAFASHVNTNAANRRTIEGRRKLRSHFINVDWDGFLYGRLTGYLFINKDRDVPLYSHSVLGARIQPNEKQQHATGLDYTIELARQQSRFNNPIPYLSYYWLAEISTKIDKLRGKLGFERFGGDSDTPNKQIKLPYGKTHHFNGLAEVFTEIPNSGLNDLYLDINGQNSDITLGFTYHYFRQDSTISGGSGRAGQEVDLYTEMPIHENIYFHAGFANYIPKTLNKPRTKRFWVSLNAQFG